jgi:hypothetical protein
MVWGFGIEKLQAKSEQAIRGLVMDFVEDEAESSGLEQSLEEEELVCNDEDERPKALK